MRVTARAMLLLLAVTMVLAGGGEGRVAGQELPAPAASPPPEEFVRGRTLVGSVALILAVPITTTLAAYTLRHRGVERGTDA